MNNNIPLYAPNGNILCYISSKKRDWYAGKELSVPYEDGIQLTFEPAGNGAKFLQKVENVCVVCGKDHELSRHHVVPFLYRKHFPLEFKQYRNYDIVLVCREPCHDDYEIEAEKLKEKIHIEFNGRYDSKDAPFLIKKLDSLENFVRMWRRHFVEAANPQHLPVYWNKDFLGYEEVEAC